MNTLANIAIGAVLVVGALLLLFTMACIYQSNKSGGEPPELLRRRCDGDITEDEHAIIYKTDEGGPGESRGKVWTVYDRDAYRIRQRAITIQISDRG